MLCAFFYLKVRFMNAKCKVSRARLFVFCVDIFGRRKLPQPYSTLELNKKRLKIDIKRIKKTPAISFISFLFVFFSFQAFVSFIVLHINSLKIPKWIFALQTHITRRLQNAIRCRCEVVAIVAATAVAQKSKINRRYTHTTTTPRLLNKNAR